MRIMSLAIKGIEAFRKFRKFAIAKIKIQVFKFFILLLGLRLQRYLTNTKMYLPKKVFRNKAEFTYRFDN